MLEEADLTSSSDSGLMERSVPAELGSCDVFVSHSWHDPGDLKWRELQKWVDAFRDASGFQTRPADVLCCFEPCA